MSKLEWGFLRRNARVMSSLISFIIATLILSSPRVAVAGPAPACGDSAPTCNGSCPEGQKCINSQETLLAVSTIVSTNPLDEKHRGSEAENATCECAEVLCGGVPLENGQGCCNGHAFTIGVDGCCAGAIVSVGTPCDCSTDLETIGCCALTMGTGVVATAFSVASEACCQQQLTVNGSPGVGVSAYSFNQHIDCCAGAETSTFCGGTCHGTQCETDGCCQCHDCELGAESRCAFADSDGGCFIGCGLEICNAFDFTRSEPGICLGSACATESPAPAASHGGIVVLVATLAAVAALGIARRQRTRP